MSLQPKGTDVEHMYVVSVMKAMELVFPPRCLRVSEDYIVYIDRQDTHLGKEV